MVLNGPAADVEVEELAVVIEAAPDELGGCEVDSVLIDDIETDSALAELDKTGVYKTLSELGIEVVEVLDTYEELLFA